MKFNRPNQFQPFPARWQSRWLGLSAIIVIGAIGGLWFSHHAQAENVAADASPAVPTVAVAKIDREDLSKKITIPAEFRPYQQVELHAKVSGYVNQMNVDFGDKVKAGQLLATLEVPELQDELNRALAAEQHAKADYRNVHLDYARLVAVNKEHPNLVAEQDLDAAEAKDLSAAAAVAAAKADAKRFQTMVDYTRIIAPFDGVVTRRYADPGALIQAGTASDIQAKSLVQLSDDYQLRLDFPVSVDYVKYIKLGDPVEIRVESLDGKPFTGAISRFTQDVDEDTRTMTTEIEVPNRTLELDPGMYATVVLPVEKRSQVLAVPTEAITGDKKDTVYVVTPNHEIEVRKVTLGLETPDKYEVVSGLNEGDLAVIGNQAQIRSGEKVQPKLIQTLSEK